MERSKNHIAGTFLANKFHAKEMGVFLWKIDHHEEKNWVEEKIV